MFFLSTYKVLEILFKSFQNYSESKVAAETLVKTFQNYRIFQEIKYPTSNQKFHW